MIINSKASEEKKDPYDTGFYRLYRGALEAALHRRIVVVALTAALLAGAAVNGRRGAGASRQPGGRIRRTRPPSWSMRISR